MALLQLLNEEEIGEDNLQQYFDDLYKIVCVSERLDACDGASGPVRTTYIVDWEQLVHLLEDYTVFGEDIVEVARVTSDEAWLWRHCLGAGDTVARA